MVRQIVWKGFRLQSAHSRWNIILRNGAFFLLVASWSIVHLNAGVIISGQDWRDSDGNVIEAHDGGVIMKGSTYYLYGNDRTYYSSGSGQFNQAFYRINMYSSNDLVHWVFRASILTYQSDSAFKDHIIERPKIIYNKTTKKYVMWFHFDNSSYTAGQFGIATCDSVDGSYSFVRHFGGTLDMSLFQDTDGSAYVVNPSIGKLTTDYLDVQEWIGASGAGEGISLFKRNNLYYGIFSNTSGWAANDNYYYTAPSISGPWTFVGYLADSGSLTYESQITFTVPVQGTDSTTYMYMGDRWADGSVRSRYVWLPLKFNGTQMHLDWYEGWDLNAQTGAWSPVNNGPNLATGATVTASSQWSADYAAGFAIDSNMSTRWNAAGSTGPEWLQIDFGRSITMNKVKIMEWVLVGNRISSFKIQFWNGTDWADVVSGTTIGAEKILTFPDISTNKIRLLVLTASDPASIYELQIYRCSVPNVTQVHSGNDLKSGSGRIACRRQFLLSSGSRLAFVEKGSGRVFDYSGKLVKKRIDIRSWANVSR